jgi:hypothetical protein
VPQNPTLIPTTQHSNGIGEEPDSTAKWMNPGTDILGQPAAHAHSVPSPLSVGPGGCSINITFNSSKDISLNFPVQGIPGLAQPSSLDGHINPDPSKDPGTQPIACLQTKPEVVSSTPKDDKSAQSVDTGLASTPSPTKNNASKLTKETALTFRGVAVPPLCGSNHSVMHHNANGLRARFRDGSFFENLDEHDPDVVLITEARSARSKFVRVMGAKRKLTQRGYKYCAVYAGKNMGYAGCAIFSKIPFHFVIKGLETSNAPKTHAALLKQLEGETRVLTVEFAHFSLVTCYSPNSGSENDLCRLPKRMAFEELLSYFLNRLDNPYMLIGRPQRRTANYRC